jgi:uncharacterized membrane protein
MKVQIFKYWDRVRSGFWFLPTVMASVAVALAIVSVNISNPITVWLTLNFGWTFNGGAEGASALLGMVAGSMITIAGVVFSMTLVALSLTSSQLGPRLLRSFMRDTTTQVVLGTFIATFLYCLLVLRTIRRASDFTFVPHLSISLGVLLAVISVGVLIYFIHHVSVSIQANEVVARIGEELIDGIDRLFPEDIGQGEPKISAAPPEPGFFEVFNQDARPVDADEDGYLQYIDEKSLLALATEEDLVIRLERNPGNYYVAGSPLALILPGDRVTDRLKEQVRSLFVIGNHRTSNQDLEFGVNQLVEIAVRALSPGLNDPFTAITCLDRLGSTLCRLATRDMPSPYRYDDKQQLRIIAHADPFLEITDAAFNQIRQYGRTSIAVTLRLLETIAVITGYATRAEDRATLLRHAEMIVRGAREIFTEPEDRQAVEVRYQKAIRLCSEGLI